MRAELPSGSVTFLFTDVEGSTRLLHALGAEGYAQALAEHRRLIREACAGEGGVEVDTQGDAFFFAFPSAQGALAAAQAFTTSLASGRVQVRVGLHTGTPLLTGEGYVGDDVHFAARVASTAHGGQVVLSHATAALVRAELTDLGEHRLKDIEGAVSIYQLGEGSFPPLKTISNTNLPRPASSFLGREAELEQVLSRIEAGARLVTLTGPGGTGKTRLAIEVASTLVPAYKAGVFWVGLASLRDPALVTETIAQTLGAKESLAAHIQDRELLLLLDNLEQVVECAAELSALLEACPNLTLLVTSRELLRISGEVEYAVPPLVQDEAVSLFCARSGLEPSPEIAELCSRLDSLPLAVELAAARTRALSPTQILERLSSRLDLLKGGRDADPRQLTLRATIEWSYDLLSPEEQALFARLSVFAGGCALEAAEEVAEADLDLLQSLVEKSLLRFSDERYWMLETIREYAAEHLDDAETGRRYVSYFARLVSRPDDDSLTGDPVAMAAVDVESANLRAVLRLLIDEGDGKRTLDLTATLARYWLVRGHFHEGLLWVEEALASDRGDLHLRRRVLPAATDLSFAVGDLVRARRYAAESLDVAKQIGQPEAIAQALHDLAEVVAEEHDYARAKELFHEAIRRSREVGNPAAGSIGNLGLISLAEKDYERSRELTLQALEIFRERNRPLGCATGLINLAFAAFYCGDVEEARSSLREALELCVEMHYDALAPSGLLACAAVLADADRPREAACVLGARQSLLEQMGSPGEALEQQMHDETQARIRAALEDHEIAAAHDAGTRLSIDEALSLALASLD